MHYYTPAQIDAYRKLFGLYGATMRFMKAQVAEALLDPGLSCSLRGEKLRSACRNMDGLATASDLLQQFRVAPVRGSRR